MTKTYSKIDNKIGTFTGSSVAVSIGQTQMIVTAEMTTTEAHDPTDTLRLGIEADFGLGFKFVKWGPFWTGGPTQVAPSLAWKFNPDAPPQRVRGIVENITEVVVDRLSVTLS